MKNDKLKAFKRRFKLTTLRAKVLGFTLILLIGLLIGYGSVLLVTHDLSRNFDALFERSLVLVAIEGEMDRLEASLAQYLEDKDSDSFVEYMGAREQLIAIASKIKTGLSRDEAKLRLHNIGILVDPYVEVADEAIQFKRARNIGATLESYNQLKVLSGYLSEGIQSLKQMDFSQNLDRYVNMTAQLKRIETLLLWIFLVLLLLGMVFVVEFSQRISEPIEALSNHALQLSRGNYNIEVAADFGYDEAQVLSKAFSEMAYNMSRYIEELKGKAETETQLRLSAVENLRMQNLLKQAELMALQSQINPHFLFNTINAGLQLAILEDADQTANFLDHMARMFRYNIQRLDNVVTFRDELENLKHYYHLMKVRFQDMLEMTFDVDPQAYDLQMPPMILQPIVENALVHGLKHKETTGHILIRASVEQSSVVHIRVSDDGEGMTQEALADLRAKAYYQSEVLGHTTGLGFSNVYERLSVFFDQEDILSVTSELGVGTQVTIKLPLLEKKLEDLSESIDSGR